MKHSGHITEFPQKLNEDNKKYHLDKLGSHLILAHVHLFIDIVLVVDALLGANCGDSYLITLPYIPPP